MSANTTQKSQLVHLTDPAKWTDWFSQLESKSEYTETWDLYIKPDGPGHGKPPERPIMLSYDEYLTIHLEDVVPEFPDWEGNIPEVPEVGYLDLTPLGRKAYETDKARYITTLSETTRRESPLEKYGPSPWRRLVSSTRRI
jgi:hypothetical protein